MVIQEELDLRWLLRPHASPHAIDDVEHLGDHQHSVAARGTAELQASDKICCYTLQVHANRLVPPSFPCLFYELVVLLMADLAGRGESLQIH
ncbi:hypothetical protein OPV22_024371 [Ensete ventricosum]|uniref:Uncharacterized protein n=1 Tax=Ensete ventricosum TaxID=4639 RepID=A0AAV8QUF8_ENSVE|nr:hypothetical protein OPV22_024371 [Ensete ventricosum]